MAYSELVFAFAGNHFFAGTAGRESHRGRRDQGCPRCGSGQKMTTGGCLLSHVGPAPEFDKDAKMSQPIVK